MVNIPVQIKELVEELLKLHKKFMAAESASEKTEIHAKMAEIDKQISGFVHTAYNLTDDEINAVEKHKKSSLKRKIS
jgi:paraquat-inducible protein B